MRSESLPIDRRRRMAKASLRVITRQHQASVPVIKTTHTTETLALALARQQRRVERRVIDSWWPRFKQWITNGEIR